MKLIREESFNTKAEVIEESAGTKSHYLKGVFMQAETVNKNNRWYPRSILERELGKYNQVINEKRANSMGELGHPDTPTINLPLVSHRFLEMHFDGNSIVGKAHILDTPNGRIAKSLIDEGIVLGMSSRGLGSVKMENNINKVQEDFHLATIDIVADPSAPNAWVDGIMEGREWILRDGIWTEMQLENAQKQIRQVNRREVEEVSLLLWENFLNGMTGVLNESKPDDHTEHRIRLVHHALGENKHGFMWQSRTINHPKLGTSVWENVSAHKTVGEAKTKINQSIQRHGGKYIAGDETKRHSGSNTGRDD